MVHPERRFFDDLAAAQPVRRRDLAHLDGCVNCRRSAADRGVDGARIAAALAAPGRGRLPAVGLVAAAIAAAAFIATPLRVAATGFFAIFEPRTVAALPLTLDELRSLNRMPDLRAYAVTRDLRPAWVGNFNDSRAAGATAGFAVRLPRLVPPGISPAAYAVNGPSTQLLTFRARGNRVVLPRDIAGSALEIDLGATVIASYGTGASGRIPTVAGPHRRRSLPLVVAQMPVPRVSSTGVSLQRLVSFMLDQPGIPPRVAAAFRALGDPATTLPIPVPIDRAYTQPVSVDGVHGIGLGDDTGVGAAVIWQKNGMLFAVFATRPARDVLAIANSLS